MCVTAEHEELNDADWRTLCDALRGSIAMFDMLLAPNVATAAIAATGGALGRFRRLEVAGYSGEGTAPRARPTGFIPFYANVSFWLPER